MNVINKSYRATIVILLSLLTVGLFFQSCKKEDEGFRLDAFGPSKVERGGEIFFIGSGMDQVDKITLPADDGTWVFTEGNHDRGFRRENGGITLPIPWDYPFDQPGRIVLTLSNGSTFTTNSQFMVWSDATFTGISPHCDEGLMEPGTEITISGKALKTVDALFFANGVELSQDNFTEHTDGAIKFRLPANVPSGPIMMRVPSRGDWMEEDNFVEAGEVCLPVPIVTAINSALPGLTNRDLPAGSEIVITVERADRLDVYEKDGKTMTTVSVGGTPVENCVVNGNEITVSSLPCLPSSTNLTVSVQSMGNVFNSGRVDFTILPTVFFGYDPEEGVAKGSPIRFTGQSMNAVQSVEYTSTLGGVVSVPSNSFVERTTDGFKINVPTRYVNDTEVTLVLCNGDRIAIPAIPIK